MKLKFFYTDLFSGRGVERPEEGFLFCQVPLVAKEQAKEMRDGGITEGEIVEALRELSTGKSPGLTSEFYKRFEGILVPILKLVYDDILRNQELCETMKIGMVKLVFKGIERI